MRKYSKSQLIQLNKLIAFSDRYDISVQFWVDLTAVFINKGDVELESYGGDFDFAIPESLKYLNRINRTKK